MRCDHRDTVESEPRNPWGRGRYQMEGILTNGVQGVNLQFEAPQNVQERFLVIR